MTNSMATAPNAATLWQYAWKNDAPDILRAYSREGQLAFITAARDAGAFRYYDLYCDEHVPLALFRELLDNSLVCEFLREYTSSAMKGVEPLGMLFAEHGLVSATEFSPHEAARRGHVKKLEFLLRISPLEALDDVLVAGYSHIDVVRLLVERYGVDPCGRDGEAFVRAVDRDVDAVVDYLLPHVDVRSSYAARALVAASRHAAVRIVTALLDAGCPPQAEAQRYATAYSDDRSFTSERRRAYADIVELLKHPRRSKRLRAKPESL